MATLSGTANSDLLNVPARVSGLLVAGLGGNDILDALAGSGNNTLEGGAGDDELYAYFQDKLVGGSGNDSLTSDGRGENLLYGGDGNDTFYLDRNDLAIGDAGNDTFFGGLGGHNLTGGAGRDVFWVANVEVPTAPSTIQDFNILQDTVRVNLSEVKQFSDLTIAQKANDATISWGSQTLAVLKNTRANSLSENNLVVGSGGANNSGYNVTNYDFANLPKIGTTSKGQDIFLGGFSGLFFRGTAANGNWRFVTHTDRGPNGEPTGQNRPFFLPDFQPEIVNFELNRKTGEIVNLSRIGLVAADGKTKLTGLPNLQAQGAGLAYTDEIAVDLDGKVLPNDALGADLEGIVVDDRGDYWMVDEYRPAIYHFDRTGKLIDRFIPQGTATAPEPDRPAGTFGQEVLPAVYGQRRSNRGFEAVALEGNKLYAFMQSAIDNPDNAGDTSSRSSRNLRILEFDIKKNVVTGEYLYLLDSITGSGNARTDKLGDAVSLGKGRFAVIERDDLSTTASNKLIYQIDLTGATNINDPTALSLPTGKTIEQLSPTELTAAKITPVDKKLLVNAAQAGYTGVAKLEGLALVNANTLALLNDNDFNVDGGQVPEKLGILELDTPLITPTKFTKNDKDIFNIKGGSKPRSVLSVVVNGARAGQVNELGVCTVDDADGRIDGLLPGQEGYTEKALGRAQVILSTIGNNPSGFSFSELQRSLGLNNDDLLRFYSVGGAAHTTKSVIKSKSFGNVAFHSSTSLNLKELSSDEYTLDFQNLTLKVKASDDELVLGTALQGKQNGEVLDLRGLDPAQTGPVKANFSIHREAVFNNYVGFYVVENEQGDIKNSAGAIISVGSSEYAETAIANRIAGIDLVAANQSTALYNDKLLSPGTIVAPFLIVNGNPNAFTSSASNNLPDVYFSYIGSNRDGVDHVRLLGNNTFGFEDLSGGGDFDYNDIIVKVTLSTNPLDF